MMVNQPNSRLGLGRYLSVLFLNAFVDLGHKITIQNTVFKVESGESQILLTALVNALILIPFILLVVPAGRAADRWSKARVMEWSAAIAVVVTLLITLCYYQGWFEAAFFLTLVLAIQSAFFSPAKYGYLREQAPVEQLASGNGAVQAVTIVAILLGMFLFSVLFEWQISGLQISQSSEYLQAIAPLGWLLVIFSLLEWVLARGLKESCEKRASAVQSRSSWGVVQQQPMIGYSIIGLAIFWGISQVSIAAFPAYAKEVLQVANTLVIQAVLAAAGFGIMVGALVASRLSKGWIETGLVPLGAAGVVLMLAMVPLSASIPVLASLFLLMGLFGGMLVVPLNALVQFHAPSAQLGQILAANNWVQNVVMLLFLGGTMAVAMSGAVEAVDLFIVIAWLGGVATLVALFRMPQSLVRLLVRLLFRRRYHITTTDLKYLPAEGGALLLGNHISWLDWGILQIVSPRPIRFVIEREIYQKPILRQALDLFGVIPISSRMSRQALDQVRQLLLQGELVCLFPEGAISHTGQMRRFRRGFERALSGTGAVAIPFYIHGLWGSRFSRAGKGIRAIRSTGLQRRAVQLRFGSPLSDTVSAAEIQRHVTELSVQEWMSMADRFLSIQQRWVRAAKRSGWKVMLSDTARRESLSGLKMLTATLLFARRIRRQSASQNVGLLLPTTAAAAITNLAVLMAGRTVVNLNYSSGERALQSAIEQAEITTIYTSSQFLERLEERGVTIPDHLSGVEWIELEKIRKEISGAERLLTLLQALLLPASVLSRWGVDQVPVDQVAAIIFSSGSEGQPKGVALSHRNILGNLQQIADLLEFRLHGSKQDRLLGSLPMFHSFGFTVTTMMPLLEGIPLVTVADPTDAASVARAIEQHRATIYCGTPTFLQLLSRNSHVHPDQLTTLRLVFAGAERLRPEVRAAFSDRFGLEILEGYGMTEAAPAVTFNLPDHRDSNSGRLLQQGNKQESVGQPLPGTAIRIVDPETLGLLPSGEAGMVLVRGVQVMKGYLSMKNEKQPFVMLEGEQWYRSGDKGWVDEDGFLTIVDRYSRFAKIGGEMVSLSMVEEVVQQCFSEAGVALEVAAMAIASERKGEQIIMLYTGELEEKALMPLLRKGVTPSLLIPARMAQVDSILLLPSGKRDYPSMRRRYLSSEGIDRGN